MSGFRAIIALSFAFVVGLTFSVLSCALYGNWWPMFIMVFYVLSPIPVSIAKGYNNGSSGSTSPEIEFAMFATSGIALVWVLVLSAFCLPLLLAHAGVIQIGSSLLSMAGSVMIFGTIYAYFYSNREDHFGP